MESPQIIRETAYQNPQHNGKARINAQKLHAANHSRQPAAPTASATQNNEEERKHLSVRETKTTAHTSHPTFRSFILCHSSDPCRTIGHSWRDESDRENSVPKAAPSVQRGPASFKQQQPKHRQTRARARV